MGMMEGVSHLTLFEELKSTLGYVLCHPPHWLSFIFQP